MKFIFYHGTRDGSLTPTKIKGDNLKPELEFWATNAQKASMYRCYDIIRKYVVKEIAVISAHRAVVVIDDVEQMLEEIRCYYESYDCNCSIDFNVEALDLESR